MARCSSAASSTRCDGTPMPRASAMVASLPDCTIMPLIKSSTGTCILGSMNMREPGIFQARSLTGSFWLALILATLIVGVFGAAMQIVTLRPLIGRDPLTTILATFGMSLILQNYALWQFGPVARKISEPYTGSFHLFYLEYPWYRLMIAGLSAAILGSFWAFLKYGKYGIWIRATTQDRVMAQAMGIPVPLVYTAAFAIGAGMAAASGVLFGPLVGVNHTMGLDWVLKAFIVVVVGGMGNLGGSIAAAIFISLLEAYAAIWVSPAQAVIVSFVVLILTLLFRPTGLFVPTPK